MIQQERNALVDSAPLLSSVRDVPAGLDRGAKELIADQVLRIIRDYYVHLPLKISSMGINPVRELELLVDDVKYLTSDSEFFVRLLTTVNRVRDRHTCVKLPAPLDGAVAFLPFALESCWEEGGRPLIVSKVTADIGDPQFVTGVEITHWNGITVDRYIQRLSWETNGANPFARIAMALRSLTARPLAYMLPPEEDWVILTYVANGNVRSVQVPWRVYFPAMGGQQMSDLAAGNAFDLAATTQGVDRNTVIVNSTWKDLYSGPRQVQTTTLFEQDPLANVENPLPNNLTFRLVRHGTKTFGLIRIFSFDAPDPVVFIKAFAEILRMMPGTGIILDLRANPGGTIPAGEGILQLLTDRPIYPERVAFRVTPQIEQLADVSPYFVPWRRSLHMKYETGDIFSQGYSLFDPAMAEGLAGIYRGSVVAVIDGLSYSTTDFVAAGIQDHGLGSVIGTDPTTGAGGANVWSHGQMCQALDGQGGLVPLPAAINMNVAVRRSTRVGYNDGLPLEGLGVFAEIGHFPSRLDVLGNNEDLLDRAASTLASLAPR